MRIDVRYSYKDYPLSEKLTKRSKNIGYYTSPSLAIAFGFLVGMMAWYVTGNSDLLIPISIVSAIVFLIILPVIRNSMYKKLDAEYSELIKLRQQH